MSYMHPAALAARRKYWTRPDAYRFAPPGTPEAKPPGWLDPSATRVRLKEAQEEEARKQAQAAQEEFEAQVRALRASHERVKQELAEINYELVWRKLCRKYGYNPDQPRVPTGTGIESGRWAGSGSAAQDRPRVAQYSFGTLVGQSRIRGGGSMCFYKFSFGIIMAPGPTNRSCPGWVPAAGVSHGKLIANDN